MREKDTRTPPLPVDSSELGNVSLPSPYLTSVPSDLDDDLLITHRKGKHSCTNHLISNFVSY